MSLAIGIRYLRGYAVATDPANRERAEWPPHPARIFMAIAAAYFETDHSLVEREALLWLESQSAPRLAVPEHQDRSPVTVYVPPNDFGVPRDASKIKPKAIKDALNVLPAHRASRQARTFPTVYVGDEPVYCVWPDAMPTDSHRTALANLCGKVTYLGHSSSLVQVWLADDHPAAELVPVETGAQMHLRCVSPGTLDYLQQQYNGEAVERFAELAEVIATTRGKEQKQAREAYEREFGEKWRASATAPPSLRPTISLSQGYRPNGAPVAGIPGTCFDDRLIVLAKIEGPSLGPESTLALTQALRGAVMDACPLQPPPEWLSGHTEEGRCSESPHLAYVPMPHVSVPHADGHVLGMALVVPRPVPMDERGQCLSTLFACPSGEQKEVNLRLGRLGEWSLMLEERSRPPRALQMRTWTSPANIWASVTPIALDRFPKADRHKDRRGWLAEVTEIIAQSCVRVGLPEPVDIDIDKTSWHLGAPRARPDHGGFPLMPARPGKPSRYQVHVWLRFSQPVRGPILLGAGRYVGYGLCKPLPSGRGDE